MSSLILQPFPPNKRLQPDQQIATRFSNRRCEAL